MRIKSGCAVRSPGTPQYGPQRSARRLRRYRECQAGVNGATRQRLGSARSASSHKRAQLGLVAVWCGDGVLIQEARDILRHRVGRGTFLPLVPRIAPGSAHGPTIAASPQCRHVGPALRGGFSDGRRGDWTADMHSPTEKIALSIHLFHNLQQMPVSTNAGLAVRAGRGAQAAHGRRPPRRSGGRRRHIHHRRKSIGGAGVRLARPGAKWRPRLPAGTPKSGEWTGYVCPACHCKKKVW
jgi:hypothetical protein